GHVQIAERVLISGSCLVPQCVGVCTLAMMQGGSAISKVLPPFTVARGDNSCCGLNTIGLRRAGLSPADRLELKQLYHSLFRSGLNLRKAVTAARDKFSSPSAKMMLDFIEATKRGVVFDAGGTSQSDEEEGE